MDYEMKGERSIASVMHGAVGSPGRIVLTEKRG